MAYGSIGKGQCPVCENWRPVIKDGDTIVMGRHFAAYPEHVDQNGRCLGTGEAPVGLLLNA